MLNAVAAVAAVSTSLGTTLGGSQNVTFPSSAGREALQAELREPPQISTLAPQTSARSLSQLTPEQIKALGETLRWDGVDENFDPLMNEEQIEQSRSRLKSLFGVPESHNLYVASKFRSDEAWIQMRVISENGNGIGSELVSLKFIGNEEELGQGIYTQVQELSAAELDELKAEALILRLVGDLEERFSEREGSLSESWLSLPLGTRQELSRPLLEALGFPPDASIGIGDSRRGGMPFHIYRKGGEIALSCSVQGNSISGYKRREPNPTEQSIPERD